MNTKSHTPIIQFNNLSSIVRDKVVLKDINWTIEHGQNWVVIGPNGAGKTSLFKIILGHLYYRGHFFIEAGLRNTTAYVSFDRHTLLIRKESEKDFARHFSGDLNADLITAGSFISSKATQENAEKNIPEVITLLGISNILDKTIQQLSTGEMRKMLIAEALITSPELLLLDEPYDGLDKSSCKSLRHLMERLLAAGIRIILVTHRFEEIPTGMTHMLCMKNNRIYQQGLLENTLTATLVANLYGTPKIIGQVPNNAPIKPRTFFDDYADGPSDIFIQMTDVTVKYGETLILDHIDWQMKKDENWYISGPNGAGKSTLVSLITADNPQAYSNKIYLFGKRRGTGETIWDIKQKIGLISSEFQIRYNTVNTRITAYQVVLSGFFNSVGLFRSANGKQRRTAMQWLQALGMTSYAERTFQHLSYGEQRMLLIIRAMVKSPDILILDEPFQGVDYVNRKYLLEMIDQIGKYTSTGIIYITHQQDPLNCITHTLEFLASESAGYRIVQNRLQRRSTP